MIETVGPVPTIYLAVKCGGHGENQNHRVPNDVYLLDMRKYLANNLSIKWGLALGENIKLLRNLIEKGKLKLDFLVTHTKLLNDIVEGCYVFGNKKEGCIKWLIITCEK